MPHEMIDDEKCSKNRLYGLILVLKEKDCRQGRIHRNHMCLSQVPGLRNRIYRPGKRITVCRSANVLMSRLMLELATATCRAVITNVAEVIR